MLRSMMDGVAGQAGVFKKQLYSRMQSLAVLCECTKVNMIQKVFLRTKTATMGCSLTGKALKAGYNYVQRLLVQVQPSRLAEF